MIWLRGLDLNQRPLGYEPNELPDCSTPHLDSNNRSAQGQTTPVASAGYAIRLAPRQRVQWKGRRRARRANKRLFGCLTQITVRPRAFAFVCWSPCSTWDSLSPEWARCCWAAFCPGFPRNGTCGIKTQDYCCWCSLPRPLREPCWSGAIFGRHWPAAMGCLAAGAIAIFLLQQRSLPAFGVFGLGLGLAMTSTSMLTGRRYPKRMGAALAFLNFSWSAGSVACPLLAAQFLRHPQAALPLDGSG